MTIWPFGKRPKAQVAEVNRAISNLNTTLTAATPWDDIKFTLYNNNSSDEIPVVASCVSAISQPIASSEISGSDAMLVKLLEANWSVLVRHLTSNWWRHGIAYAAIYPYPLLPESTIVILPSNATQVKGGLEHETIFYPAESLIILSNPSDKSTSQVDAPLAPAANAIASWQALAAWRDRMLRKLPGLIGYVKCPNPVSEAVRQKLGQAIDNILGFSSRSTIVIDNGGELVLPELSDLALQGVCNQLEVDVCKVMRVPPCIAHIQAGLDASTYSNYQVANKIHYEGAVLPMATRITEAIQRLDASFEINLVMPEDSSDATAQAERDSKRDSAKGTGDSNYA